MSFIRKHWIFCLFLGCLAIILSFAIFTKQEKSGVVMIEQVKTWGNVQISKYKLKNGLKVLLAKQPDVPVFTYQTWFNVGSRHEKPGKTGIAHFFEHLMFKETKNTKEGEFDRIMERNGAVTNAATWVDWTYYYETLPADPEKLEATIRLEADRMRYMIINEKQIESERGVIMNERRYRVDNDVDGTMDENLDKLAYKVHPYGQPTIGWMQDIKNLTLEDCRYFYKTYYAPNNATIVLVGNFDRKKTLKWIEKYYGDYPTSKIPKEDTQMEPPQKKTRKITIRRPDIDSEKVIYAYHTTDHMHADTPPLELLAEILFNGEGARLYKLMVSDQEIASSVSASMYNFKHPALFQISVSMRKRQPIQKSHNRVFREIENVQKSGVTQKELDRAKNRFEMDYYGALQSVTGKAYALGHYETITGDYKESIHLMKRYQDVTRDDIQRVAKKYLMANNRSMVVGLPKKIRGRRR